MSIEEYRSPIFNFTEEELQSRKRIKGMLDFKIIYAKEDDFMSIEEIKKRMENVTDWYVDNCEFLDDMKWLVAVNQRLVEALESYAFDDPDNPQPFDGGKRARDTLQAYKLLENDL